MPFWKGLAAALGLALSVGAADAATVIYEGGGPGIEPGSPAADMVLGDFGPNPANRVIGITGDTGLYGGILHRDANRYQDAWTFDFGSSSYGVVFNYVNVTSSYDALLTIAGSTNYVLSNSGSIDLGNMTGSVTFLIDATAGGAPRQTAHWDVQIAAVPLPAGAALLLTGIGGLALTRRRAKA